MNRSCFLFIISSISTLGLYSDNQDSTENLLSTAQTEAREEKESFPEQNTQENAEDLVGTTKENTPSLSTENTKGNSPTLPSIDNSNHPVEVARAATHKAQKISGKPKLPDLILGASYVFFVPYQTGMDVGYYLGGTTTKGNYLFPHMNGDSGFTINTGIRNLFDEVSLMGNYLWYQNRPGMHTHTLVPSQATGDPLYYIPFTPENASFDFEGISSRFIIYFQRVDGYLEKEITLGSYSLVLPWIGLLGAFDYQQLDIDGNESGSTNTQLYRYKQDWWGIGPYSGVRLDFIIIDGLALFAKAGAAVLLANHKVTGTITEKDADNNLSNPSTLTYTTLNNIEPMVDFSIGLRFIPKRKKMLELFLTWQQQTYFSHNGFYKYRSPVGDLSNFSMQGLTLGLTIKL